jgi:hypothetical protein
MAQPRTASQLEICKIALRELAFLVEGRPLSDSERTSLVAVAADCRALLEAPDQPTVPTVELTIDLTEAVGIAHKPDEENKPSQPGVFLPGQIESPMQSKVAPPKVIPDLADLAAVPEGCAAPAEEGEANAESAEGPKKWLTVANLSRPSRVPSMPRFMLRQTSLPRLLWDLGVIVLLGYIAITVPYVMGFEGKGGDLPGNMEEMDVFIDIFFTIDIFMNFRTGFNSGDGCEVLEWKAVAKNYMETWFLVDFLSTVPWENIFSGMAGSGGNTQAIKLLKGSKIAKAMRLLKIGKMMKLLNNSEAGQVIEETLYSSSANARITFVVIFLFGLLLCHWLACLMAISGPGFVDNYSHLEADAGNGSRYLVALYWAMTTMSTVGYGDITPHTDTERLYCIIAMVIGCGYWGFVLGSMTSIISNKDLNTRAYWARMDDVKAWVDHHKFPTNVRRRIRRYFHNYLSQKSAPDEGAIMNDMSPGLRDEVSKHLVNPEIRACRLLAGLPNGALARLINVVQSVTFGPGEVLAREGEVGMSMFIITSGTASYTCSKPGTLLGLGPKELVQGDSFGEEIVMGFEELYNYQVTATTEIEAVVMEEATFLPLFWTLPSVVQQIQDNFYKIGKSPDDQDDSKAKEPKRGRASMIKGTGSIPLGFPDAVFDSLEDLGKSVEDNKKLISDFLTLFPEARR